MQACGVGFELLANGRFALDPESIARRSNRWVIRSWLLERRGEAFREQGNDLRDGPGRFSRRLANRLRYGFGRHDVPR